MKKVALSEVKDDLSRYLHVAETEEVIITRHGKPAGLLIGFASEEDWFDYALENNPLFSPFSNVNPRPRQIIPPIDFRRTTAGVD